MNLHGKLTINSHTQTHTHTFERERVIISACDADLKLLDWYRCFDDYSHGVPKIRSLTLPVKMR